MMRSGLRVLAVLGRAVAERGRVAARARWLVVGVIAVTISCRAAKIAQPPDVAGAWEAEGWVSGHAECGFFVSWITLSGTTAQYSGIGVLDRPGFQNKVPVSIAGSDSSAQMGPLKLRTLRRSATLLTGTYSCAGLSGEWSLYRPR
jgi:hypothetical protein